MATSFIIDKTKKIVYGVLALLAMQQNPESKDKIVYDVNDFIAFSNTNETHYGSMLLIDTPSIKNSISYTEEAKKYLRTDKNQQDEILVIAAKLREYFKGDHLLVELIDGEILINVLTSMPFPDSINLLKRFDKEWWADRFVKSDNYINVDVINI